MRLPWQGRDRSGSVEAAAQPGGYPATFWFLMGSLLRWRDYACLAHVSEYPLIWVNKTVISLLGKVKKSCKYEIQALK
jgi:hypothetical protein